MFIGRVNSAIGPNGTDGNDESAISTNVDPVWKVTFAITQRLAALGLAEDIVLSAASRVDDGTDGQIMTLDEFGEIGDAIDIAMAIWIDDDENSPSPRRWPALRWGIATTNF